jgi:large subunit ribosomal protein L2
MGLKSFRPLTPAARFKMLPTFEEVTSSKPEKSLLVSLKKSGGRNNTGRITCRHIGGGHKRKYRLVDFKRSRHESAKVLTVEYDPNRTARISLIQYADGTKSYILAPQGLVVGQTITAGSKSAPEIGNALPLSEVPLGTSVHNIEMIPGRGGRIARAAGQAAVLSNRDGDYVLLKMPSGEIRKINAKCYATIGVVGNGDHMNVIAGKAGRTRWLGVRPTVRGMCMNPVDHPNGGGEGRSKSGGGRKHLKSPWGQLKGQKTRQKRKASDKLIVSRRKKK